MRDAILNALVKAADRDEEMGGKLNQRVKNGNKKDVVTQGDIEIGDLITQHLLESIPRITVESEEHGKQTNLLDGEEEKYYVAIDDIDGTNNLRVGKGFLAYCSMIVAFDGSKKTEDGYKYSDYSHAACLDYASGKIFYTEKGLGKVEVYDINLKKMGDSLENVQDNSNLAITLSTDLVSTFRGGLLGYEETKGGTPVPKIPTDLDLTFRENAAVDSACSVYEYAMVGVGIRNGYASAGKKQHELPMLYAFLKETGGEMVDFDGVPYDDKIYEFKAGNASVIAGNSKVVEKVKKSIDAQIQSNKEEAKRRQEYDELKAENERLKIKNSELSKSLSEANSRMKKSIEFVEAVKKSPLGQLFFGKKIKTFEDDSKRISEGKDVR